MVDIFNGDALTVLRTLADESVQCVVTSPPYWGLRDYGVTGQLGLEETPYQYTQNLVLVFREVRRVLKEDGTLWLNLGDCFASTGGAGWQGKHGIRADRTHTQRNLKRSTAINGLKPKDLVGIPWRVAFALRDDGWYLRSDIIWHKPNPIPESVMDRPTRAHEYLFLLSKSRKYFFDRRAFSEPVVSCANDVKRMKEGRPRKGGKFFGLTDPKFAVTGRSKLGHSNKVGNGVTRNRRTVWTITTKPFKGAHFATFPEALVKPCIMAGSRPGSIVLDPFAGSGTTSAVALALGRTAINIEINPDYVKLQRERLSHIQTEVSF